MLVLTFRQFITESISDTKVTGAPNNNVVLNTLKTLFSGAPYNYAKYIYPLMFISLF